MQRFVSAIRESISEQNWLSALAMTLTLPEICANVEGFQGRPAEKYVKWFDANLLPIFLGGHDGKHVILSGSDCYALRCSYLHDGSSTPSDKHKAREVIRKYHFREPPFPMHCCKVNDVLQLRVDTFCEDVCGSVEKWESKLERTPQVIANLEGLLTVYKGTENVGEIGVHFLSDEEIAQIHAARAKRWL